MLADAGRRCQSSNALEFVRSFRWQWSLTVFEPKTLSPLPDSQVLTKLVRCSAGVKISAVRAAPGEISEPGIAADLAVCGNRLAWRRPSAFDLRPALESSPPDTTTVVVDAGHGASESPLFLPYLFDLADRLGDGDVVVLSDRDILPTLARSSTRQPEASDLLHACSLDAIRPEPYEHLLDLARHHAPVIPSLARSSLHLGRERFEWSILAAPSLTALIGNIVSLYLSRTHSAHLAALEATCLLGYAHQSISAVSPVMPSAPSEPWWEPLSGGWLRLSPTWQTALAQQCAGRAPSARRVQKDLVDQLVECGAECEAIDVRVSTGAFDEAAKLIHRHAESLLSAGHYDVLSAWLNRIPLNHVRKARQLQKVLAVCVARAASAEAKVVSDPPRLNVVGSLGVARVAEEVTVDDRQQNTALAEERPGVAVTAVGIDLLGPLRVKVGGAIVKGWTGATGRNLLRYIAAYHPRPVTPEQLQETFWPDVAPSKSRNRLHVALHALRADLRRHGVEHIFDFRDGAYRFADDVDVVIDTTEFSSLLADSVTESDLTELAALLEKARAVYRGDFLEDSPYESWPTLDREMWKVRYLGLLERLAHTYFALATYRECVAVCQELITKDLCRDDMHQLTMRCFSRLDQPHLAMRQFELCRAQMKADLGTGPGPDLVELLEAIRGREVI
jgi:DNA-binding SARP family transcriptional activator